MLYRAARSQGISAYLVEFLRQTTTKKILNKIVRRFTGSPLIAFQEGHRVLFGIKRRRPDVLITCGISPLLKWHLSQISLQSVVLINFSTDDPWNPAHRAGWFLRALPEYDRVFSTRKANLGDFAALRVKASHLPFGYDQDLYFWDRGEGIGPLGPAPAHPFESLRDSTEIRSRGGIRDSGNEEAKVFLAGGGDGDRYPLVKALNEAGIGMSLWGGYWEKAGLPSGGFLDASGIRREAARCMVSLVLVRRANRDGSAMRSFEIPACGACCVAEDTEEHRELYGPDGEAVLYFKTPEELVRRVKEAFGNPELRARLRRNAHRAITGKPNTYVDRLRSILEAVGENSRQDAKVAK